MRSWLPESGTTDLERAYAAGIYDGEGCVVISTRKSRTRNPLYQGRASFTGSLSIGQSEPPDVLHWLAKRWGGSIQGPYQTQFGSRPHFRWTPNGRIAQRFLREIRPYVVVRFAQVDNALAFFEYQISLGKRGSRGYTVEEYEALKAFHETHKAFGRASHRARKVHEYV